MTFFFTKTVELTKDISVDLYSGFTPGTYHICVTPLDVQDASAAFILTVLPDDRTSYVIKLISGPGKYGETIELYWKQPSDLYMRKTGHGTSSYIVDIMKNEQSWRSTNEIPRNVALQAHEERLSSIEKRLQELEKNQNKRWWNSLF